MLIDLIRNEPLKFSPGAHFNYCNSNYLLLGVIIESASGKSYGDFVKENIFEPLGMSNSGCDISKTILKNRAAGYNRQDGNLVNCTYELVDAPFGDAHIYTTVEDMLLWDQALYTDQLVSLDTLDAIFTPYEPVSFTGGYYGYGWDIVERAGREVLQHTGSWWGFDAYFGRLPAEKVCIVILSNFQFVGALVLEDDLFPMVENLFGPRLVAHWALDETEGMIVTDSVGNNNGYALGDPIWKPDDGQVDGAIQLDGADDYIITAPVLNPSEGPFSIFAWVLGGAPGQVVISEFMGANWLMLDAEGKLMTELKDSSGLAGPLLSETTITDGEWHRISLVWDGSNRRLYVDEVVVAEDVQDGLENSYKSMYIGTDKDRQAGTFWDGLIDDVRIYN